MAERKSYLLRLDPETFAALQAWAADDLRSVNGQAKCNIAIWLVTLRPVRHFVFTSFECVCVRVLPVALRLPLLVLAEAEQ